MNIALWFSTYLACARSLVQSLAPQKKKKEGRGEDRRDKKKGRNEKREVETDRQRPLLDPKQFCWETFLIGEGKVVS
jgi:hypothetical protein